MQELGFYLLRIMNGGYVAALYTIMLFVLMNTPVVLDIVLNALAIDFIHRIDEDFANAEWWDPNKRAIKAGTLELIIRHTLELTILENPSRLCAEYGIVPEEYKAAVGDKSLKDLQQAQKDDKDSRFITDREALFEQVAAKAAEKRDFFVLNEYRKQNSVFRVGAIFTRYRQLRTWSRWNAILFLPKLPVKTAALNQTEPRDIIVDMVTADDKDNAIAERLFFVDLFASIRVGIRNGKFANVPVKIVFGILDCIFLWYYILFFFVLIVALVFIPICY